MSKWPSFVTASPGQCERLAALTGSALAGQQLCIISGGQGTHHGPGVLWSSALVCAHKGFDTASIGRVFALSHVRVSIGYALEIRPASPLPSLQLPLRPCRQ